MQIIMQIRQLNVGTPRPAASVHAHDQWQQCENCSLDNVDPMTQIMCAPQVVAYCLAVLEEESRKGNLDNHVRFLNVHFVKKTRQSRFCNTAEISQFFLPDKNTFG
jgi:hypothetical protein